MTLIFFTRNHKSKDVALAMKLLLSTSMVTLAKSKKLLEPRDRSVNVPVKLIGPGFYGTL